jgi:DNA-binding NarL/FixJ family response regulator
VGRERQAGHLSDRDRRGGLADRHEGGLSTELSGNLRPSELSWREIEVLQLISDGLPNREIALQLFVAEETVKSHVQHLLAKIAAPNRASAVATGFRLGLIT